MDFNEEDDEDENYQDFLQFPTFSQTRLCAFNEFVNFEA